jgi:hypothetical protein
VTLLTLCFAFTHPPSNMVQNWITPAHEAILEKHRESYNSSFGTNQNNLLQIIKKDLKEVEVEQKQGASFPKSLKKVNQIQH